MIRRGVALSALAVVLAGSGQGAAVRAEWPRVDAPATTTEAGLSGHHWELRTVTENGQVWVAPQNPGFWLTFTGATWSGQDGCNDRSGAATYTETAVQLAGATETSFVCHGDDSARMVTDFALLLQAPAAVAVSEGVLTLTTPSGAFVFHDTSKAPLPDTLEGKLVGWYWRIQSTTVKGVTTATPKDSSAAINFSDQDFDASDDCGRDYTGSGPVTYTDDSVTTPGFAVSAVGCPQTPLDAAYDTVLQRGTIQVALVDTTLTLSRGGARLVYTRGPAAAYKSDFLAGPPPKPLTAARVAASVAGPTWQLTQLNRGTEYWGVPRSYPSLVTLGPTSFTITYGCVTWTGPITYSAFGITVAPQKTTGSCTPTGSDRKVDATVTLLLADTFTAQRGGGRFLALAGGGVYLSLSGVLPPQAPLVIAPKFLKPLLLGKPWSVTTIGKGRAATLVAPGVKASVTLTGSTFTARAACAQITGRLTFTRKGAQFAPLHQKTCAMSKEVATVMATYRKVLRGLPKFAFGYGESQVSLTAGGTTLVLGRYGP
jgi:heat shock protein HslJ